MKICDTLLVGSGYYATGFAEARGGCLIAEEGQVADTSFYLPMRGLEAGEMHAVTAGGERLLACIRTMGLMGRRGLCVNGLESALARHILDIGAPLLLKCRAVRRRTEGGLTVVTLATNEGLCEVSARQVIDTRPHPTALFQNILVCGADTPEAEAALLAAFPGARLAPAFYEGRRLLSLPADGHDEGSIKLLIHERFPRVAGLRLLYIAPAFFAVPEGQTMTAAAYPDPVAAYDAGFLAGEVAK